MIGCIIRVKGCIINVMILEEDGDKGTTAYEVEPLGLNEVVIKASAGNISWVTYIFSRCCVVTKWS